MSDLDKAIEEQAVTLFKLGMMDALGGKDKPTPIPAIKEAIENIKSAFADAGWLDMTQLGGIKSTNIATPSGKRVDFMTGQEWYKKFKEHADKVEINQEACSESGYHQARIQQQLYRAAKKAAGLE